MPPRNEANLYLTVFSPDLVAWSGTARFVNLPRKQRAMWRKASPAIIPKELSAARELCFDSRVPHAVTGCGRMSPFSSTGRPGFSRSSSIARAIDANVLIRQ